MPPNIAGGQKERGTRGEGLENVADEEKENVGGKGWLDWGKAAVGNVLGGNKEYEGINEGIGFSDVAPYLVISTKSWEDASRRLPDGEEMDITKFRPNIVIEGAEEEYEEDYWAELEIGNRQEGRVARFVLTNNCARCNSLNVDFKTGKVGEGESGKILKKLNSNRRVDQGAKWSPVFGRYGFLARVDGGSGVEIKVGDEVRVLNRNDKHTRFGKWVAVIRVPRLTYYRMATAQYEQLMSALQSTSGGCPYAIFDSMLMNVLVDLVWSALPVPLDSQSATTFDPVLWHPVQHLLNIIQLCPLRSPLPLPVSSLSLSLPSSSLSLQSLSQPLRYVVKICFTILHSRIALLHSKCSFPISSRVDLNSG